MNFEYFKGSKLPRTVARWCHTLSQLCSLHHVAAVLLIFMSQSALSDEALDQRIKIDIADNTSLEDALIEWGNKAQVTVMMNTSTTGDRRIRQGIHGTLSARDALILLLKDSGLSYTTEGRRIQVIPTHVATQTSWNLVVSPTAATSSDFQETTTVGAGAVEDKGRGTNENSAEHRQGLQEVIVTAEKRSERLQDVPVPVTAISAESLVDTNQVRLQDYYTSIPGLTISPFVESAQFLSIRGITTGGFTNPTVGIVVDDMPYGSSTFIGGGDILPDIDPGDLARVEVLRGPQGTLYGASSMGGLIKFVTVDPSATSLSGRVQAGLTGIHNGDGLGYNVRGSGNIPISDTLALRLSGFVREDPGYINDPILRLDGVNKDSVYGGHLAALWKPSQNFSLKLSALYQDSRGDGSSDIDVLPALYGLQQSYIRNAGGYDRRIQAYSATVNSKLGFADLTAITGYSVNKIADSFDLSSVLGGIAENGIQGDFPGFGVDGVPVYNEISTEKFTQEIRLDIPLGDRVDWLLGGFYTHETSTLNQQLLAVDPLSGFVAGGLEYTLNPTRFREIAGFTDVTFHFTDSFDIQLGGRESFLRQEYVGSSSVGPLAGSATVLIQPEEDNSGSAFTYLVTPEYKFSPNLMVYARLASGYRAGGSNCAHTCTGIAVGEPIAYSPDKTENYEIGTKGSFFDHLLTLDASVYYIDWKDIQLALVGKLGGGYNANGGKAKSQGVELSATVQPYSGLTLAGWVVLSDAQLTQNLPSNSQVFGAAGDPLPYSSRFSANFSVDQQFPIYGKLSGFVGGTVSYVGYRNSVFQALQPVGTPQRQIFPAYAKTDLRAGFNFGSWTLTLSGLNLTDRRGVLNGGEGSYPPYAFTYIQPRSLGLSIVKIF
jgi:iron complex outermembrane recepter protein